MPLRNSVHILLVEDNPVEAELLQEYLAAEATAGFRITHCIDLKEGIAFLAAHRCDVIFLDLHLPGSSGLATYLRLKGHAGDIPVVILTGLGDEQVARTAIEQGAHNYLRKDGLSGPLLIRTITTALVKTRCEQPWNQCPPAALLSG